MKQAKLVRFEDDGKETLGRLFVYDEDGSTELFNCKTLELPWKNNQRRISCIPKGTYICSITRGSEHIPYQHYDVHSVTGRDGIKIHSANYVNQLLGCIAVGSSLIDMNKDGELDVTSSRDTLAKLIQAAGDKFELRVM